MIIFMQIGIIGGTGLDDAQILENRTEKVVNTPYGNPSDVLIEGQISGVDCVLLARFVDIFPYLFD
jgi:5'-methylthioadenosine phosphorylase